MTINPLTPMKKIDWTTVATASPETVDLGTVARRITIIAAVPPCAGTTELIAVRERIEDLAGVVDHDLMAAGVGEPFEGSRRLGPFSL